MPDREKVMRGLKHCSTPEMRCEECPYYTDRVGCSNSLCRDALALLKEQEPRWIPVTEEHPKAENGESKAVLVVDTMGEMRVAYWDGGCWNYPNGNQIPTLAKFPITHYMPLPEPPKEDENEGC